MAKNDEETKRNEDCQLPVMKKGLDILSGIDESNTAKTIAEMYIDAHFEEIVKEITQMDGFEEIYEQCMKEKSEKLEHAKKHLRLVK